MRVVECEHCKSYSLEVRKRIYANKSIHYVKQCLNCGWASEPIKHYIAEALSQGKKIAAYDPTIAEKFRGKLPQIKLF